MEKQHGKASEVASDAVHLAPVTEIWVLEEWSFPKQGSTFVCDAALVHLVYNEFVREKKDLTDKIKES